MRRVFRDPDHEAQYQSEGGVVVPLLDADDLARLLHVYASESPNIGLGFHATLFSRDEGYRTRVDAAVQSVLAPRVAALLDDYRPVVGNFVVKEAGQEDSVVPVHQDWTLVDETTMRSINVWCPLVDTTADNGQLQVFKGSHRLANVLRGAFFPNPFMALTPLIMERYLTALPLRAGEALVYDHALVHASPPNRSASPRIAVNMALVPAEAPLFHAHLDRADPGALPEIFAVNERFFLRNVPGERPTGVPSLGFFDVPVPVITPADLERCQPAMMA